MANELILANANMRHTYSCIAKAAPDIELLENKGFVAFRSPLRHPVSNFAIGEFSQPQVMAQLREWIEKRPIYHLYSLVSNSNADTSVSLLSYGFRQSNELITMAAPQMRGSSRVKIRWTVSPTDRLEASKFMADQFFARQTPDVRSVIAHSACGSGLPIGWLESDQGRIGAFMSCLWSECLGIYNFCIDRKWRGVGMGKESLAALRDFAGKSEIPLILQCDATLVGWYQSCGLEIVGHVDIWELDNKKSAGIIN
jgi:hypothetical protein